MLALAFLWSCVFLFSWTVIGAFALAWVDKDKRLFSWYSSAPNEVLRAIVLMFWPVIIFLHKRKV